MVFVLEPEGALSSALLVHALILTGTVCPYRPSQQLRSQWSVDNGASSDKKLLKIVLVINETSRNESAIPVHFIRKERTRCDNWTDGSMGPSAGLEAVGQI
jgi:hypothetical protein